MTDKPHDFNAYFKHYVDLVNEDDPIIAMNNGLDRHIDFFRSISKEKGNYRYADDKWSIKEILQHIIDCERIFNYRALSLARGEKKELMGFDHDAFAKQSLANNRNMTSIIEEYELTRLSTMALFNSFNDTMMAQTGIANGLSIGVSMIAFLVSGHEIHHINVIKERYL